MLSDAESRSRHAADSMADSLRRTVAVGVAATPIVLVMAATSELTMDLRILVLVHVGIVPLAVWGMLRRSGAVAAVVALIGIAIVDLAAAVELDEPLALATIWVMNFAVLAASLMGRGWRVVAGSTATVVVLSSAAIAIHPEWRELRLSTPTTGFAMVVAIGLLVRFLYRYADQADREVAIADQARDQALLSRVASREASDAARTMHDTVINTLAAIASGGAATQDPELVRERCRRDVVALAPLAAGYRAEDVEPSLTDIGSGATITVHRMGLSGDELLRAQAKVPVTVLRAMRGAADESVRNVERHAGVDRVTVAVVSNAEGLAVTVTDEGVGFAGTAPAGHGISESIVGRLLDVGAHATVDSRPGEGTTVTLAWSRSGSSDQGRDLCETEAADDHQVAAVVDGMRQSACWAWAAGVVVVGLAIDLVNRPGEWSLNYWALLLVAVVAIGSWFLNTRRGRLPAAWIAVLIAVVPVTFVLTYYAVETEPYRWLALTVTPPLVILLVMLGRHTAMWCAVGLLLVTGTVVSWRSPDAAGILVIGTVVPLALLGGWLAFYRVIGHVVERAEQARAVAATNRAEITAQTAVRATRQRWQQAGLADALETLRAIAEGDVDPRDEGLRHRCAEEERFLRQVMMLSPEAVHIGPPLARALAEARAEGVALTVRTADVDVASDDADLLGRLVLDCVAAVGRGAEVTASTYPAVGGLRLVVVADADLPLVAVPPTWRSERSQWGAQRMLEVVSVTSGTITAW